MGVFKKLKGNDIRVTPIQTRYGDGAFKGTVIAGTNKNPFAPGEHADRNDFYDGGNTSTDNDVLVYNSIRQLFYGSFISPAFLSSGSVFNTPLSGSPVNNPKGNFSRFDPSFQGSTAYNRTFPVTKSAAISVLSIDTSYFGESIVPGTVQMGAFAVDDSYGNLIATATDTVIGNVFYDQGIIVRTDGGTAGTSKCSGSYTVYSVQYKCTADAGEFNYSLNPTLLTGSNVEYDSDIIDSPEFMPYVTTIGLYNENQELMMVGKLSQPCQLNPYTDTNFIVRIDR